MVGSQVQDDVPILLRFRGRTYVIAADICRTFGQVKVNETFRPLESVSRRPNPWD